MKKKKTKKRWLKEPEDHDYSAAKSYLSLLYDDESATKCAVALKKGPMADFAAKDIFRASALPLLGTTNSHVKSDQKKLAAGKKLSPLLLVRDTAGRKVIIADGYHRICAVYAVDEDALVPCKIV